MNMQEMNTSQPVTIVLITLTKSRYIFWFPLPTNICGFEHMGLFLITFFLISADILSLSWTIAVGIYGVFDPLAESSSESEIPSSLF